MESDRWFETLPYGPLNREDHNRLALSVFDNPSSCAARAAEARGIRVRDYSTIAVAAEPVPIDQDEDSSPSEDCT